MRPGASLRPRARSSQNVRVRKSSYTFGILTTPAKDIFHSNYHRALLSGILPRIKALKGRLKIIMMPSKPFSSLDAILDQNKLDGLLILTWRWIHPSVVRLIETTRHPRVLVINDPVPGLQVNSVYTDTDAGLAQAVAHLVKKSRRKIGMLHGPWAVLFKGTGLKKRSRPDKTVRAPFIDTQLKVKSLMLELKARRLRCEPDWFRSGAANSESEGYRVMSGWLREKELPEAIVCGNDDLAFGAVKALKEAGKNVPYDMAVIGFDDNERAKSFSPPLTTVRQPLAKMGKDAVDVLARQIRSSAPKPLSKRYAPKLIVRKTA